MRRDKNTLQTVNEIYNIQMTKFLETQERKVSTRTQDRIFSKELDLPGPL